MRSAVRMWASLGAHSHTSRCAFAAHMVGQFECLQRVDLRRSALRRRRPESGRVHLVARPGRNRNGWFGVSNGNKQTFVHGDCQRQQSTPSGGSAARRGYSQDLTQSG